MEYLSSESDKVYTPDWVAQGIVRYLDPKGSILDPCRGEGAFYNNLKGDKDFCEIAEGIDFFKHTKSADWIISNPPYSILLPFLKHSFSIATNVSYLLPVNKVFQSQKVMRLINEFGGIKSVLIFGDARQYMKFPFGYSVANFHFQKDYKGDTKIISGIDKVKEAISQVA